MAPCATLPAMSYGPNSSTARSCRPSFLSGSTHSRTQRGGLTRHPLSPAWPLKLLTRVTLEEALGGRTRLTLQWSPLDANEEEQQTFAAAHPSMQGGWTGTFDQLAEYLARASATG
jgi:uncharacterized protein YndB with AHSA1/START domain